MKLARKAYQDIGIEVVDFEISEEILDTMRDCFMSMVSNSSAKGLIRDVSEACETFLPALQSNVTIL